LNLLNLKQVELEKMMMKEGEVSEPAELETG